LVLAIGSWCFLVFLFGDLSFFSFRAIIDEPLRLSLIESQPRSTPRHVETCVRRRREEPCQGAQCVRILDFQFSNAVALEARMPYRELSNLVFIQSARGGAQLDNKRPQIAILDFGSQYR
jgi:hypothetical protein